MVINHLFPAKQLIKLFRSTGPVPGSFGADETQCWEVRDTLPGGHVPKTSCLSHTYFRDELQEGWEEKQIGTPLFFAPLSFHPALMASCGL